MNPTSSNPRRLPSVCLMVLTALLSLAWMDGCGKTSSSSSSSDGSADAGAGPADTGAQDSNAGDDEPIDPAMFDHVKSMMQLQVDSMATQSDTLRQAEQEHPDAQLKGMVDQMEAKVAEAKKLMEKATTPAQSRVLKVEVPKLLGEVGELTSKATARLMEIMQAGLPAPATPAGGDGGGGGGGGA